MDGAFPSAKGEGFEVSADYGEQRKGFRGNAENAKTKLCMRWVPGLASSAPHTANGDAEQLKPLGGPRWKNGHCRFGDRCNFAHGEEELRRLPARGAGNGFQADQFRGASDYRAGFDGASFGQRSSVGVLTSHPSVPSLPGCAAGLTTSCGFRSSF